MKHSLEGWGRRLVAGVVVAGVAGLSAVSCARPGPDPDPDPAATVSQGRYPWHTDIVATTFWVGEIFDPTADDGSQELSTYDSQWLKNYGGCDGVIVQGECTTEPRTSSNGYFPSSMTPLENPFYLDLPYDDIHNAAAFAERGAVIPWAQEPGYAGEAKNKDISFMKNRWVRIRMGDRECYGQIQDAGPGEYQDKDYVFGADDARPKNKKFNGAGMDVSPALNGCLGFRELNGQNDRVDWQFVDRDEVPAGPWLEIETRSQVR